MLRRAPLRGWASLRASMARQQATAVASSQTRGFAVEGPIEVEVAPFKAHKIDPPPNVVTTTTEELKHIYSLMFTMRRMEIAADMMYKAKLIRGFCHLYDGQEAVMAGIEQALTREDSLITSYRDHCQHLARGGTVLEVMAELMGKKTGASHGLGGSMHMYRRQANFFGGCGIVGAQIPLGAGLALAHKYSGRRNVAITMYGDGAANQGQKYEALNMAGLWGLPVIFVCENNHYGMGTAEWRAAKSPTFYTRGDYIPGLKVDGMDVLAVKQAMAFAREYSLDNGPIILEMDTYRYHGHSMSDPGSTYRTRDEISSVRTERDPVERVKKLLLGPAAVDPSDVKKIEREAKRTVDSAVEQAKADPTPPDSWVWRNAYAGDGRPDNAVGGGAEVASLEVRNVLGDRVRPIYDPTYKD